MTCLRQVSTPNFPRWSGEPCGRHSKSLDGPINGLSFLAYVEQFLVATLTAGDVVVMDNPIEQVFARLKTLPRKAGERTIEATWRRRIGTLLDEFNPDGVRRH
jgi:transposase